MLKSDGLCVLKWLNDHINVSNVAFQRLIGTIVIMCMRFYYRALP